MSFIVQEVSVDGSHIHPQTFHRPADACELAARIANRGSDLLCYVKVLDDRTLDYREIRRFAVTR